MKSKIDWKKITSKLPTSKTDPNEIKRRKRMYLDMDPNRNGYLSLAEVDKGILDLGLEGLFNCKPAIMRAFNATKNYGGGKGKT